jgi:hypothetical protein
MKKASLILVWALLCSVASFAQMRMPAPSPAASVSQAVGSTEVAVKYSSPGMKGRTIWGDLLPYGKIWRAGANSATIISFQDDVTVGDKELKGGEYSLFVTPKESGAWAIYFDPSGQSVYNYDEDESKVKEAKGIVMIEATPSMVADSQERLKYYIELTGDNSAHVILRWGKVKLAFEVKSNPGDIAQKSVEAQLANWYSYASAAQYYIDNDLDMELASAWAGMALKLNDKHFFSQWVMATLLAKQGKTADAIAHAKKAKELGEATGGGFYAANKSKVEQALATWK